MGGLLEQKPYAGMVGGGCVVLRRDTYVSCPLDARFRGWGQEDSAWGVALTSLYGAPWRGSADLWHLYHPPQPRMSRSRGSMVTWAVFLEYQRAAEQGRMRAYLDGLGKKSRERNMSYVYRNRNTNDEARFPSRNARLDALGNWELIAEPDEAGPPFNKGGYLPPGLAVEVNDTGKPIPVHVPEPVVTGPDSDLYRPPTKTAGKLEWLAYARWRQVPDCDGMSKARLIAACGQ
jgi:hypothetical protein